MAKLFPKTFPKDSNNSGERKVFEYFQKHAPEDWYILHSFRIPKHKRVVFGEADFIVIAPTLGVFILEIKSGGIGFDGTNWSFTNHEHKTNYKQRGPFEQAREAMFEIERILTEKLGDCFTAQRIHYSYGVIFTDEYSFPAERMTEDESWRLLQRKDNNDYCAFIKYLAKRFNEELIEIGKRPPNKLTADDAKDIATTLRPIVECTVPLKSFLSQSEEDIINYTKEQLECLDDIFSNDRVVVNGGAGTGKTLIAIEEAKQIADYSQRVGVLCFNKNLASYIRLNVDAEKIEVYSIHAFMSRYCKEILKSDFVEVNETNKATYYSYILPQQMMLALSDKEKKFDYLIIDEFQDLCTEQYLQVFDMLLKDGLSEGKFTFFGDFARQAIYLSTPDLKLLQKFTYYTNKMLTKNCRNTKSIGVELIKITGYTDKGYRLQAAGEPVEYVRYTNKKEAGEKLMDVLRTLKNKGIKNSATLILSPYVRDKSVVGLVDPDKYLIGDYSNIADAFFASFSTIHAYKGLESQIVILVDIEDYSKTNLMYIGISRARSKLFVLESKEAEKQRKSM